MCSVVGYVGRNGSRSFVFDGLSRLEYRGYDSAGFACFDGKSLRIKYAKATGRLEQLATKIEKKPFDGSIGIGHTRWSTHGASSEVNAHPHFDCHKRVAVVHNGIIENYHELHARLQERGHAFHSQTDTEVVAHLIEELRAQHTDLKDVFRAFARQCEGAYALVILLQDCPDRLFVVRRRSPLCIGVGEHEMFVASDLLAFAGKTRDVLFLPDDTFAVVQQTGVTVYNFDGKELTIPAQQVHVSWDEREKNGHEHYMLKEIYEQKGAIHDTVDLLNLMSASVWDHLNISPSYVHSLQSLNMVACGTSWHAARIAQFFFEQIAGIPTRVSLASEFCSMPLFPQEQSLYLAISQSGETADTLAALRMLNQRELPTAALTNVPSSTMVREAGGFLLTEAKPEIAVASTKAFSTQLAALYWLAHRIAYERKHITQRQMEAARADLLVVAELLESAIEEYTLPIINSIAPQYAQYEKAIFLGRHLSYPFAMEAALKLKEVAYIFSQCYPAGELKHGPIALLDDTVPVFLFSCQEPHVYQKLVINAQEVKARGGNLVVFGFEGQDELFKLADTSFSVVSKRPLLGPLAMTGLMQFLVYSIAKVLNRSIDKPRNLAKSVTVG